jgi:hypothetical protein
MLPMLSAAEKGENDSESAAISMVAEIGDMYNP